MRRSSIGVMLKHALATIILVSSFAATVAAGALHEATGAIKRHDYATALRILRPLADRGDAGAQGILGIMYANGQGVPKNDAQAMKWFRKAADQGNATAQGVVGHKYLEGQGVPQDYAEAAKWFRKAADQGEAAAQEVIGVMYLKGQGVSQDDTAAVKWFRLAANQGFSEAQYNLGVMYTNGRGIPQDFVAAHVWFNLAAAQGDQDAAKERDRVASRMDAAQIAEAQKLAREWKPNTQTGPGAAVESVEDEASSVFDIVMIWSACQTLAGVSDAEALSRAGKDIFPRVISGFQKVRPEMVGPLAGLTAHTTERYEHQLLFLRALSSENRDTICWGVNQSIKRFYP